MRAGTNTITHNGQTKTYTQWAETLGMTRTAVAERIARGWTPEEAVSVAKGDVPDRLLKKHGTARPVLKAKKPTFTAAVDTVKSEARAAGIAFDGAAVRRSIAPAPVEPSMLVAALGYEVQHHPAVVEGGFEILLYRRPQ